LFSIGEASGFDHSAPELIIDPWLEISFVVKILMVIAIEPARRCQCVQFLQQVGSGLKITRRVKEI